MKKTIFLTCALIASFYSQVSFSNTPNLEIQQHELRSYDPQKTGLKDLVFEARIDKLVDMLNETGTFGKLSDVYFKIHWLSPDQYKIEVMGLPKGFEEVRNDLSMLIKTKLELIIPEMLSSKFKNYALKTEDSKDAKVVRATDTTGLMVLPEVEIYFDKSGKLSAIETRANGQNVKTEFSLSPKSWSQNKLVVDKIITVTKQGLQTNTVTNTIEYLTVSGVGFPSVVKVNNLSEATIPAQGEEKEKHLKQSTGSIIKFSNYEVNTGKAQRYMMEGLKR